MQPRSVQGSLGCIFLSDEERSLAASDPHVLTGFGAAARDASKPGMLRLQAQINISR